MMKLHPLLYALPALLTLPAAQADITMPGAPAPQAGPSDLLAANAVHAVFKEIRSVPVVSLNAPPSTSELAVFEVKQNLAYRRYDRMGDGALTSGKLFAISLADNVPGQAATLGAELRTLQPGDEVLMNIDHIYVFGQDGGENVRACTRFAKVQPRQPEPLPQQQPADSPQYTPTPVSTIPANAIPKPDASYVKSVQTQISIESDGKGGQVMKKIEIHREQNTATGQETVRKFINDVEVDPRTDQPLVPQAPADNPAPQAMSAAFNTECNLDVTPEQPAAPASSDGLPPIPDPKPINGSPSKL